jgi:hypothetical protein
MSAIISLPMHTASETNKDHTALLQVILLMISHDAVVDRTKRQTAEIVVSSDMISREWNV